VKKIATSVVQECSAIKVKPKMAVKRIALEKMSKTSFSLVELQSRRQKADNKYKRSKELCRKKISRNQDKESGQRRAQKQRQ